MNFIHLQGEVQPFSEDTRVDLQALQTQLTSPPPPSSIRQDVRCRDFCQLFSVRMPLVCHSVRAKREVEGCPAVVGLEVCRDAKRDG